MQLFPFPAKIKGVDAGVWAMIAVCVSVAMFILAWLQTPAVGSTFSYAIIVDKNEYRIRRPSDGPDVEPITVGHLRGGRTHAVDYICRIPVRERASIRLTMWFDAAAADLASTAYWSPKIEEVWGSVIGPVEHSETSYGAAGITVAAICRAPAWSNRVRWLSIASGLGAFACLGFSIYCVIWRARSGVHALNTAQRESRLAHDVCAACGYPVGVSLRCTECGASVAEAFGTFKTTRRSQRSR